MDWQSIFGIEMPLAELVVRGTAMYWFLFLLFRFVLRRDVGQIGVADILLLVLIADAAQNGMAGDYQTITEGIALVGTLAFWNWLLDWLAYHSPAVASFVEPPTVPLVRHGRLLPDNLRRELLTEEELMSQLRKQEVESLTEVRHAFLEADGKISLIRARPRARRNPDAQRSAR